MIRGFAKVLASLFLAAFGVGVKSDVLTFLIGIDGTLATVSAISRAVGYTETAVRDAVKGMALARLIHETADRPAAYATAHQPWVELLELRAPWHAGTQPGPPWRMWAALNGFLSRARDLATEGIEGRRSDHVLASRARDTFEDSAYAFSFHQIEVPPPKAYSGREFITGFERTVEATTSWIRENA